MTIATSAEDCERCRKRQTPILGPITVLVGQKKEDSSSPLPESSTYGCPPFRALDPQPYKTTYRRTDRVTLDRPISSIWGSSRSGIAFAADPQYLVSMTKRLVLWICLFVLLAVVGLRPLIGESYRASGMRMTAALAGTKDPWAATTLVLDGIVVVAAAVVLLIGDRAGRRTGLGIGAGVWVVAAIVSTLAADEMRPAISASFDLLAALTLCVVLVRLLDSPNKVVLGLCVVIASAGVYAATCMDEAATFDETEARYMENREAFWRQQGVPLDSPRVHSFEGRMRARDAGGYFAHSNLAGGYLVTGGFAALALAAGVWRRRRENIIGMVIALMTAGVIFAGAALTHGAGAFVGALVGAGVLVLRFTVPRWFAQRRRVLMVGWSLVAVAVIGLLTLGFSRGGLPNHSLDFRWRYWMTSMDMFADHWATGVGAENYGDAYLGYKPITSPEEIKNPHNFLVQFATEYGALGLVGAVIMLVGGSITVTRRRDDSTCGESSKAGAGVGVVSASWLGWCVGLAMVIFLPRMALLPSDDTNYLIYMTGSGMLVWCAVFLLNALSAGSSAASRGSMDDLAAAVNCGLLVLLVQDTASFLLFTAGGRTTFFALLAVSISARGCDTAGEHPSRRPVGFGWRVGGAVALIAIVVFSLWSPVRMEAALRRARALTYRGDVELAVDHYRRAVAIDELDATAPAELSRYLANLAGASPEPLATYLDAIQQMSIAIERAPNNTGHWRSRMRMHIARGMAGGGLADFEAAVADARRIIALYPSRPRSYVDLADALALTGTREALTEAIEQLKFARQLDQRRLADEVIRRLSPKEQAAIERRIEQFAERLK